MKIEIQKASDVLKSTSFYLNGHKMVRKMWFEMTLAERLRSTEDRTVIGDITFFYFSETPYSFDNRFIPYTPFNE